MGRFRFRLAQLLRLRQAEEDREKRELQSRLGILSEAEAKLLHAETARQNFAALAEQKTTTGLRAAELVEHRRWHEALRETEDRERERVAAGEEAVDEQRETVRQARLESRTLERLEDRQKERFTAVVLQQEQNELDEMVTQKWSPNRK